MTSIYQEIPFITSPSLIYVKEIISNFAYLSVYISGSHFLACFIEKLNGVKRIYYFVFVKVN